MTSWMIGFDGYEPGDEGRREALCTVGNGYFATRGAWTGSIADGTHYPGTYLAGCYNRLTDDVDGRTVDNESLVNLPDWLPVLFAVGDGDWFGPDTADVIDYRQELDLRRGVLTRRFRLRDRDGHTVSGVERRFVSMADLHLAGLSLTITAEGWSGRLRIRSGVAGSVQNCGVERYRRLSGQHLDRIETAAPDDRTVLVTAETCQSHTRLAIGATTTVAVGGVTQENGWRAVIGPADAHRELELPVTAGAEVTVHKTAAVFSSRDRAISEPAVAVVEALDTAAEFDDLLERHELSWSHLWERFEVHLDGAEDGTLTQLHLNLFHLLQSVSPHSADADAGVPARGLHGEAYRGHIFWDELFVFPVLTLRMPALTRALLRYRYRRLPAARRAARAAGYEGAMYPWQSGSDGREESQRLHLNPLSGRWTPDATYLQRHVGIAVAYTMWQYFDATDDTEFLTDHGAEVIVEVARFFAGLATYDHGRDRFVIRGVVGPDEFHTGYPDRPDAGIDNNAYTNLMAVWVLRRAAEVLDRLPGWRRTELTETIGLRPQELIRWDEITRRMYVPFHGDGLISQFEGYADLAELDWDRYRKEYGDLRRLDRILEAEGRSVTAYQVSKQADVLMLLYLLSPAELHDLLDRLGYQLGTDAIPRTIGYYLDRTSHGSTLSAAVHAWGLASLDRAQALHFLTETLRSDSDGPTDGVHGGTTAEGIHLAAMAASVDLLQRRFTGLRIEGEVLSFDPNWPPELGELRMTLRYRQHRLSVAVSSDELRVVADPGNAVPIRITCCGRTDLLPAGGSLTYRTG